MNENKNLPVLGTKVVFEPIKKSKLSINKIKFVDSIPSLAAIQNKWDVSDAQNGSIMAWLKGTTLYISGNGVVQAPKDCTNLFSNYYFFKKEACFDSSFINVEVIDFNSLLDTSNVEDTTRMFWMCESLETLNLTDWNTQNLQDSREMFHGCKYLNTIDVSNWDTKSLKNTNWMFYGCYSLRKVDVSNWNTYNIQNASCMFWGCESLKNIDVSNWNTENLKSAFGMFGYCLSLKYVDISNWNTDNLIKSKNIFKECTNLKKVITKDSKLILRIDDKSIIQAPENCSIADKMKLMQQGISIKPSQDKISTTKEQTRSKNTYDISR